MRCPFCHRNIPGAHIHQKLVFPGFVRINNIRQERIKETTLPRPAGGWHLDERAPRVKLIIVKDWG